MHTARPLRTVLLLSICGAMSSLAQADIAAFSSPLNDANVLQRQLQKVVATSSDSVFAVTAFSSGVSDSRLFQKSVPASRFMQIAEAAQRSCGTAFAIDEAGYLLTNEHVISGASSVWVTSDSGQTLPALVVGSDPRADLAVLRVPTRVKPIAIQHHSGSRGDLVVTIGNPNGISIAGDMSASVGCISATGRALPTLSAREHRFYGDLLQITTPIATGSSGGPLINLAGEAIGIVCAVVPNTSTQQNIGFAITLSPAVQSRIELLKRGGDPVYGYIGVNVSPAESDGGTVLAGARIDRVDAGTPAAGVLAIGDIVLKFDNRPVGSDIDFIRFAGACDVGRDVPLTILRADTTLDLTVRPRKRTLPIEPINRARQRLEWSGVTFANAEHGVAVTRIAPGSDSPFEAGQVINAVNGTPVSDLSDLLQALHDHAGDPLEIELLEDVSR